MKVARLFRPSHTLLLVLTSAAMLLSPTALRLHAQAPATQAASPSPTEAEAKPAKPTPKQVREAEITAESERLLQLAKELKAEVDKSNKDTLSLAVIKKAAEIEKLANTLRLHLMAD